MILSRILSYVLTNASSIFCCFFASSSAVSSPVNDASYISLARSAIADFDFSHAEVLSTVSFNTPDVCIYWVAVPSRYCKYLAWILAASAALFSASVFLSIDFVFLSTDLVVLSVESPTFSILEERLVNPSDVLSSIELTESVILSPILSIAVTGLSALSLIPFSIPLSIISPIHFVTLDGEWIPKTFLRVVTTDEARFLTESITWSIIEPRPSIKPRTKLIPISTVPKATFPKASPMALTRLSIETITKSVLFSIAVVNPSIKEIIKLNAASTTSGILLAIPLIKPTIKSPPASTISGI